MNHRLLVTCLVIRHQRWIINRKLFKCLADTRDVSVTKNSKDTRDCAFAVIAIDGVLMRQEFNDCLAYRHLSFCHDLLFLFLLGFQFSVRQARIRQLRRPRISNPHLIWFICHIPDALGVWSCHDVEEIEVITGPSSNRTMPAVWN